MVDNIGELNTRVRVHQLVKNRLPGEMKNNDEWVDIGNTSGAGPPKYKYCKWVGAHGSEAFKLGLDISKRYATLTLYYDSRIMFVYFEGTVMHEG